MKRLLIVLFCLHAIVSSAQFKNIKIADEAETNVVPLSPSIAISRKHGGNIIVALAPNRTIVSLDTAKTWNEVVITSPLGFAGTPSINSDYKGVFYLMHSSDPVKAGKDEVSLMDRIVLQKSDDKGKSWSDGSSLGLNPPKDQARQALSIFSKSQTLYATWTQFDTYGLDDAACHSNILFSISNGGGKWSKPKQISQTPGDCNDREKTVRGSTPAAALDGKLYAVWGNQGTIYFDRSYDEGDTWLTNDLVISKEAVNPLLKIPGVKVENLEPTLVVDYTQTRVQGSLYVTYAYQKYGANDTDIWITRSNSHGENWAVPLRVNGGEPGKHQFHPKVTIDQTSGYIYIIYYDRRAYDDLQTDVYLAYSIDGGNKFKEIKISETPFIADESKPFEAYTNIDANAGLIMPTWVRTDNGKTSVWTTVIKEYVLYQLEKDKDKDKEKKDKEKKN